jgi:hypothetical protein
MGAPKPEVRSISSIKYQLMQPALTSHFECYFSIPPKANDFIFKSINEDNKVKMSPADLDKLMIISCSDASLPGSSLSTHDLNNDFTGVTQRHVYRRLYDNAADFTFYVDQNYTQIRLFEAWLRYIVGEQVKKSEDLTNFYRVQYPKNYKTTIYISKFERNIGKPNKQTASSVSPAGGGRKFVYSFFNAFPSNITSMPISYESSQLLKVTVSFTYDRYVASNTSLAGTSGEPAQSSAPGVPNNPYNTTIGQDVYDNAGISRNIAPSQFNLQPPEPGATGTGGRTGADIFNVTPAEQNLIRSQVGYNGVSGFDIK